TESSTPRVDSRGQTDGNAHRVPVLTAMGLEIVDRKKKRTNPPVHMFDPRCPDGRCNLCPSAASGACQRSSSRYQTTCDSRFRSPPRLAHCICCLEGAASREELRNADSITEFEPNHFRSESEAGVSTLGEFFPTCLPPAATTS